MVRGYEANKYRENMPSKQMQSDATHTESKLVDHAVPTHSAAMQADIGLP